MASEGPNNPGTLADDSSVGTVTWSTPEQADDQDGFNARADNGTSHYLKATNFGFSIPDGATINGILVEIYKLQPFNFAGTIFDNEVKIVKGGSVGSTNKADASEWSGTGAYVSYGGSSDLWDESWQSADINSSDFGAVVSITSTGTLIGGYIDHIRITVYYTESVQTNPSRASKIIAWENKVQPFTIKTCQRCGKPIPNNPYGYRYCPDGKCGIIEKMKNPLREIPFTQDTRREKHTTIKAPKKEPSSLYVSFEEKKKKP